MNASLKKIEPLKFDDAVERDRARLEIDNAGFIQYCNIAAERLFRTHADLIGAHISAFVSRFAGDDLIRAGRLKPGLSYLCGCGVAFRCRRHNGEEFLASIYVNDRIGSGHDRVRLVLREVNGDEPGGATGRIHLD